MTYRSKNTIAGEALAASLSARGLTQSYVAKTSGLAQSVLSDVINGKRLPSADWLDMIADALEVGPEERLRLHRAGARAHGFKIDLG